MWVIQLLHAARLSFANICSPHCSSSVLPLWLLVLLWNNLPSLLLWPRSQASEHFCALEQSFAVSEPSVCERILHWRVLEQQRHLHRFVRPAALFDSVLFLSRFLCLQLALSAFPDSTPASHAAAISILSALVSNCDSSCSQAPSFVCVLSLLVFVFSLHRLHTNCLCFHSIHLYALHRGRHYQCLQR